jgi:maltooligosyltrehalose trehalohydrolase
VRRGRTEEFAAFAWQGEIPDPQAKSTFLAAKINPGQRRDGMRRTLFEFYRQLIRLRKERPSLKTLRRETMDLVPFPSEKVLALRRRDGADETLALFHFGAGEQTVSIPTGHNSFRKLLDSADEEWGGSGPLAAAELAAEAEVTKVRLGPWSFVLYGSR